MIPVSQERVIFFHRSDVDKNWFTDSNFGCCSVYRATLPSQVRFENKLVQSLKKERTKVELPVFAFT